MRTIVDFREISVKTAYLKMAIGLIINTALPEMGN